MIEDGLINENLSGKGNTMPDVYNDRGVQMKAKPFMAMLQDLGMANKLYPSDSCLVTPDP